MGTHMGRPSDQMMQIGDVALRTGLSLRTVRYYEEAGLVVPCTRTSGGFRLYGTAECDRLELIKRLKPLGFSLDEMREILQLLDDISAGKAVEDARKRLRKHTDTAEAHCRILERQLEQAREISAMLQRSSVAAVAGDDSPDV